ncbi:MAG: cupin domain-containing protein [Solirubrobacterales bacterium]
MSAFDDLAAIRPQAIWDGLLARAVHGERITLAVVELAPEADLPEHSHENEQLGMVLRGSLSLRVGDEERVLGPGETWRIDSNTPHSGRAGSEGAVAIDVFAPPRRDWDAVDPRAAQAPLWP